ncbi:MAG: Tat pathway signal sequence domain protein [Burkholderiales bacterium]|nr:Tat pathway signal sequence domain protein [Burkholderiales bacterium]
MFKLTRRSFIKTTAATAFVSQIPSLQAQNLPAGDVGNADAKVKADEFIRLNWLEAKTPQVLMGTTVGIPWPRGKIAKSQQFQLINQNGKDLPTQSWPLAYWPDGTLKWTAHAVAAGVSLGAELQVKPVAKTALRSEKIVSVRQSKDGYVIDTGLMVCEVAKQGAQFIRSVQRDGKDIMRNGHLVVITDDQPDGESGTTRQHNYISNISQVSLEQNGPVRAVLKVEGMHKDAKRAWLPFVLRLYFYAGADTIRVMHSFIYDGDEQRDFLRGIGLRFDVAMRDALYDRHVRFAGENTGLWAEGVRNMTGLRRDPGPAVRNAQLAGLACPPLAQFPEVIQRLIHLVPAWGDYTLSQQSADGFKIRKRTKSGFGWVEAAWGHRSPGTGYIGGVSGGVAFGLRDFWQRHPTQLDIRQAHTDTAQVTVWMWSPDAPAMDLRFYHDGMGMETHDQEREGLEITYEDYEKGFGSPMGVARSSEITLWVCAATPSREKLVQFADAIQTPPQLVAKPSHFLATGVFGGLWSLSDRSHPVKAALEDQLDFRFNFYKDQVEQRHWYGFWDYGDIRHTYDLDRHEWRYDVGGFAWDNSELSPDLWLWYSFLRTGRADIFRFAEAMVRHTSEVDTHHLGQFAGLGSRHNVQHWGCSAKQLRISAAVYRRFYYYLTADERIGDIMHSLIDADKKLESTDPARKLKPKEDISKIKAHAGFGTDWGSLAGNWLTEWERSGDIKYRDKILTGMRDIAGMPHGFFNGNSFAYDADTSHLINVFGNRASASHLNAVFGAVEIFAELATLTDEPKFVQAWLQYCELFNAGKQEQIDALGMPHGAGNALRNGHSRLTAYVAWKNKNPVLAQRAWREFFGNRGVPGPLLKTIRVQGVNSLNPVDEVPWISTNDTAQWGLAAIQNLALIGEYIPSIADLKKMDTTDNE